MAARGAEISIQMYAALAAVVSQDFGILAAANVTTILPRTPILTVDLLVNIT